VPATIASSVKASCNADADMSEEVLPFVDVSLLQTDFSAWRASATVVSPSSLREQAKQAQADNFTTRCLDKTVTEADFFKTDYNMSLAVQKARMNQSSGSFLVDALCFGGACDSDDIVQDLKFIWPTAHPLITMLALYRQYSWLNFTEDDLSHYISFTRFGSGMDKLSCDWCSIINGLNELTLDKLKHVSAVPDGSSISEVTSLMESYEHFPKSSDVSFKPTAAQLAAYDLPASTIAPLLEWRNAVEYIEQRWCPFKTLQRLNFNRSYYAFSTEDREELMQAQAILKEKKRITGADVTCESCNKVINEQLIKFQPDEPSLFDRKGAAGLSYMDRLKCALGIECREATVFVPCPRS